MIVGSCNTNTLEIKLVGALSPVNHEGLHQGCLKNTLKFFFFEWFISVVRDQSKLHSLCTSCHENKQKLRRVCLSSAYFRIWMIIKHHFNSRLKFSKMIKVHAHFRWGSREVHRSYTSPDSFVPFDRETSTLKCASTLAEKWWTISGFFSSSIFCKHTAHISTQTCLRCNWFWQKGDKSPWKNSVTTGEHTCQLMWEFFFCLFVFKAYWVHFLLVVMECLHWRFSMSTAGYITYHSEWPGKGLHGDGFLARCLGCQLGHCLCHQHLRATCQQWHRKCRTHLNVLGAVAQRLQDTSQCPGHSGTETAGHISMSWTQWHRLQDTSQCSGHSGKSSLGQETSHFWLLLKPEVWHSFTWISQKAARFNWQNILRTAEPALSRLLWI